jgi:cytidylate kinase
MVGVVVALDGPSGTGKSTAARTLAQRLGLRYLDTGAMYRAATVAVLDAGLDPGSADAAKAVLSGRIEISTDPTPAVVRLDGRDVSTEIRSAHVTTAVSAVSALASVREALVAMQRALIGDGAIVVEGRDIGSVVWPQAQVKVYLTADPLERARRRAAEAPANSGLVTADNVVSVARDLARRDDLDSSRSHSPLMKPEDSVEVDTTFLTLDQVVDRLAELVSAASNGQPHQSARDTEQRHTDE